MWIRLVPYWNVNFNSNITFPLILFIRLVPYWNVNTLVFLECECGSRLD